jgi:GTP-binding protein YchF
LRTALVGLPGSGKTTLFNLLTGSDLPTGALSRPEAHVGAADVPDTRLSVLAEMYHPRKVTPAKLEFIDIPGVRVGGAAQEAKRFLADIREVDALVHVLQGFPGLEDPDPVAAAEALELELAVADLDVVERRLERIAKEKKRPSPDVERDALQRIAAELGEGRRAGGVALSAEEEQALRGFTLLTQKPLVLVLNGDESQIPVQAPLHAAVAAYAAERGVPLVTMSVQLEHEIQQLPPEEQEAFLSDLGLQEPGIGRLSRGVYEGLGRISFLTAGTDEVRAWTVRAGVNARTAAGAIHSDIERGFIRAEVVAYDDLVASGSMAKAKDAGTLRLEGKEYIVQDGDIINFRFAV